MTDIRQPIKMILAEGKIELCCTGFEGSLAGVYMTVHKNGCHKDIGLNELLSENQAIKLEGKQVKLILEVAK